MWVIITEFLTGSPLFSLQSILHAKVSRVQIWPSPKSTMPSHCLQHNVKFLSPTASSSFSLTAVPFGHSACLSLLFCSHCVMQPRVLWTWDVSSCLMLSCPLLSACLSPSQFHSSCWSAWMPSLAWRLFRPPVELTDCSLCSHRTLILPLFEHLFSFCFALAFVCCLASLPTPAPRTVMASKIRPCLTKSTYQK